MRTRVSDMLGIEVSGQVAGRIDAVLPMREILETTWNDCRTRLRELGERAAD